MTALPPATTAAEQIAWLCDRLAADDRVRLISRGKRTRATITGSELARLIRERTDQLRRTGVGQADTVLFAIRPSPAAIVNLLALISLGTRTALLDFREPAQLLSARAARLQARWVLAEPLVAVLSRTPLRQIAGLFGVAVPPLRRLAHSTITTGGRPIPGGPIASLSPEPEDEALLVFTSGTTADPKAVVHTQATVAAMFEGLVELVGDAHQEVVLSDQFHSLVPTLAGGATLVIGRPGILPPAIALLIKENTITTWFTTPAMALEVVPRLSGVNHLRRVVLGSAPVTKSVVDLLDRHLPDVQVTAVYAMTEAVPVATTTGSSISDYAGPGDLVGPVVEGITVEIDPHGEIIVAGARVGRYLEEPDSSAVQTGDLGHWSDRGELVLDGRIKDMILVDARNIYPQHYEDAFGKLAGVASGALVGLPADHGNEELWGVVEMESSAIRLDFVARAIVKDEVLGQLPMTGLVAGHLPRSGRSQKLDRAGLRQLVQTAVRSGSVIRMGR